MSRFPARYLPAGRFAAVLCLLLCSANATAQAGGSDGLSPERLQRIDRVMGEYVEQGRLPGAVMAVARAGGPPHIRTVGAVQADSIFRIFSMTKPVTSVAVLMLYEEGRFLLGDPVSRYLPEFSAPQVYVGENETRPAGTAITIEHLLTHTAGLSYDDTAPGVPSLYAEADIWSAPDLAEFSRRVAALPLVFEPGERWHYSVANDVLGRLVEVVSGQPFDEFLQARIFGPLQMVDTRFYVPADKVHRLLPLYRKDGEGMRLAEAAEESSFLDEQAVPFGGGGLVSTAGDYLRFARMLLGGGELDGARLLAPKTVELMMLDHLPAAWGPAALPEPWIARTENRNGSLELGLGYGYGGYVITDVAANSVPGSVGTYAWGGAASTYFFVDPAEQLTGIFLTQLSPSDSYPLRAQFRGLVYQSLVGPRVPEPEAARP